MIGASNRAAYTFATKFHSFLLGLWEAAYQFNLGNIQAGEEYVTDLTARLQSLEEDDEGYGSLVALYNIDISLELYAALLAEVAQKPSDVMQSVDTILNALVDPLKRVHL